MNDAKTKKLNERRLRKQSVRRHRIKKVRYSERPHIGDALFFTGISPVVKAAFKAKCAKRGTTMKRAVVQFMREYVGGDYY